MPGNVYRSQGQEGQTKVRMAARRTEVILWRMKGHKRGANVDSKNGSSSAAPTELSPPEESSIIASFRSRNIGFSTTVFESTCG
jgi:hypothetical protein